MHELSIAGAVAAVAIDHARGRPVAAVGLTIGHLRQVVPAALSFAFELVARGTELEGARLEIEAVPAAVACRACGAESAQIEFPLHCAVCSSLDVEVVRGEELRIEWIELEEASSTSPV